MELDAAAAEKEHAHEGLGAVEAEGTAGDHAKPVVDALDDAVGEAVAGQLNEERVNIACGGRVLADKTALHAEDGDEVALLPPVSGG